MDTRLIHAMKRTTVAPGIYRDAYGYEIRWRDKGEPRRKRFPLDTPIDTLKNFRQTQSQRAKKAVALARVGSFVRDAVRFLKTRRHLPSFQSDRSHLRPWIHRFRKLSRWAVTHEHVSEALHVWSLEDYSTRTLRHRLRILRALYQKLDAGIVAIPTFGVTVPQGAPAPLQRRPTDDAIVTVARRLQAQEQPGSRRLRDAKTRARFLVLGTMGMRPAQLKRAVPADLSLDERLWVIHPAKGDKGAVMYLNDEMLAAARLFVAADAWGDFDSSSFVKTLYRNGWPRGVRPYNMRHAVGQALRRRGAELGDISDHFGHRSLATTRQFYVEPDPERMKATSERLNGRLSADVFDPLVLPPATDTNTRRRKAKEGGNRRKNAAREIVTAHDSHERKNGK